MKYIILASLLIYSSSKTMEEEITTNQQIAIADPSLDKNDKKQKDHFSIKETPLNPFVRKTPSMPWQYQVLALLPGPFQCYMADRIHQYPDSPFAKFIRFVASEER